MGKCHPMKSDICTSKRKWVVTVTVLKLRGPMRWGIFGKISKKSWNERGKYCDGEGSWGGKEGEYAMEESGKWVERGDWMRTEGSYE